MFKYLILSLILSAQSVFAAESHPIDRNPAQRTSSGSRWKSSHTTGRDYSFFYNNSQITNRKEGSDSNSVTLLGGTFMRNFGQFEIGGGITIMNVSGDNVVDSSATGFHIVGDYNFLENVSGVEAVPFARIVLATASGSDTYDASGWSIGGGLKWFPFGEIFAVEPTLSLGSVTTKYANIASKTYSQTSLAVAWSVYF